MQEQGVCRSMPAPQRVMKGTSYISLIYRLLLSLLLFLLTIMFFASGMYAGSELYIWLDDRELIEPVSNFAFMVASFYVANKIQKYLASLWPAK